MPLLFFESVLPCSPDDLWEFHASVEALKILTPPGRKVEIIGDDRDVRVGALHILRVRQFGLPMTWHARITEADAPHGFVDEAERSPFKRWRHAHEFLPHPEGAVLRDTIEYELPLGVLGQIADRLYVRRDLEQMFAYRHDQTRAHLTQKVSPEPKVPDSA